MTVYIDQFPNWLVAHKPKWIGGGHLFGTNLNELHEFAKRIGLKREWFQDKGFPHYDLTANKREQALLKGAIAKPAGEIPEGVIRRMPIEIDHDKLEMIRSAHYAWRKRDITFSERYVPGEGDNPRVMLIGEAPGAQEDLKRRPFVGDSGLVLRELMAIAGLYTGDTPHFGKANCWLTNVVKFRPPRNRTPSHVEIMTVRHLLREEWNAIGRPNVVVPIGGVALTAVYGRQRSILKLAGTEQTEYSTRSFMHMFVFPMLHPSYGLRGGKDVQDQMEKHWEHLGEFIQPFSKDSK